MSWVMTGMAALGAVQAANQRKAQKETNKANAEMAAAQTEFSPWTGAGPGKAEITPVTANAFSGALQGGLSGAMYKNANAKTPEAPVAPMDATPAAASTQNMVSGMGPDEIKRRQMMGMSIG